jgi:hypothetical protein
MSYNWVSLFGDFELTEKGFLYHGRPAQQDSGGEQVVSVGNFLCDQRFQSGRISGDVTFLETADKHGCEFILYYEPQTQTFLTAGLNPHVLCAVRSFSNTSVQLNRVFGSAGDRSQIRPNRPYRLEVRVTGSRVVVSIDGVDTVVSNLPMTLPLGQTGIWCAGNGDILVSDFKVEPERPKVFVVMQFSEPYNQLHLEVIKPVCEKEFGLEVVRADEIYGPGLIISDIEQNILQATIIIADVTPVNANVYYELGYAHALRKQTILIAAHDTKLPFDISPFRTLFYENTIAGKARVEQGLRNHLRAIQQTGGATPGTV